MRYTIRILVNETRGERITDTVGDYLIAAMVGDEPPDYEELKMVLSSIILLDTEPMGKPA